MIFRSIRWRLTLSFAGIALLAAFVLGAALLAILEDYYARMEFEYLWSNAQAISAMLTKIMATDLPKDVVQLQIENFSFLSQTRVRVLDENGQTLYESNIPQKTDVAVGVTRQRILIEGNVGDKPTNEFMRIITVGDVFTETLGAPGTLPPKDHVFFSYRLTSAVGTPFGFELGTGMSAADARSIRKARVALVDSTGKKQGAVELTEGPALGRAIVNSVLRGWIVASVIAVVLAAIAGWFISRRISAPVLALTNTTTRMANGDLSSRADISSRDEFGALARAFNAMADEIETTVNALRRFAADAAHELNTPLTALRADLDLALTETQPRALIQRAQATVKRLEELNRNLLDLARLEAARENKNAAPIDLSDLVRQLAEVYASQAEQADVAFQVELPDAPVIIRGDALQIQRAIGNLIENALKFTPPKGNVRVQASQNQDGVSVSVSDTGIGISPDDLPQLFNRFHRGRNATSYPGSGLGLAIVKAIAEQNDAEVRAENLVPGVRFTLQWHKTR